ncbi:MAG TPA: AMP-binding protein, partial [Nakamurella sp.]|nr:AMP-binding protein [Nakamurella sp.]
DATGLPVTDALATILAAARAGVPVLIADPAGPRETADAAASAPPGTFLIAVTSGTSGRPRPVLRTAASWTSSFSPLAELAGLSAQDRVLLTGPLHATMHLFAAVHTLWLGAELTDRPDHATAVHAVPAVLADLLAALSPTAPLRTAVVAGSALPVRVADDAAARGVAVTEYYGAAELSFVAAARHAGALRPFPGADVQLRDGEIWVRSPYLASGYASGVIGPLRRDQAGYATVGDLGEWLDGGGLRVRGRGDAAITTGGATVIAEDIEAALCTLPGVRAAAVVGVPHRRLGEVVAAVIEPTGIEPTGIERAADDSAEARNLDGIRSAARLVLHGPSLPRRWFTVRRLPRTGNGKIARALVGDAVLRAVAGDGPPAGGPQLRPLP